MKTHSTTVTWTALILASASLLLGATLHAQNDPAGYYLTGDAGASFGDNVTASFGFGNNVTSLNTGVRADVCGGYNFDLGRNFYLAPELELGYLYNSFTDDNNASASLDQVPVLANGVLTWQFAPCWSVYGGLGVGAEYMYVTASDGGGGGSGGVCWQAKLGVQYRLGPGDLGLGYEYLGVTAPFINVANHTVFASYTLHF